MRASWAGNVASWGHAIECAVLMTENDRISLEDLAIHVSKGTSETLEDPIEDTLEEGPPLVAAIEPEAGMAERAIASP